MANIIITGAKQGKDNFYKLLCWRNQIYSYIPIGRTITSEKPN